MGWIVVYIAPNRPVAEMLRELLQREGLLATVRSACIPHMGDLGNFEVLVPSSEAQEASELITQVMGRG